MFEIISTIISVFSGLYVGGWLCFIKPIMTVCVAYDAGTLTGAIVGMSIIKILLSGVVVIVVMYIVLFVLIFIDELFKRRK